MKDLNKVVLLFIAASLMCCNSKQTLNREAYIRWMNDPECPLKNEKQIGDYTFIAQYKPIDLVALGEFSIEDLPNGVAFDSIKKEFEGMQYFVLKIGVSDASKDMLSFGISNQQEYYNRVEYFATHAQQDLYLVEGTDTLPCRLYHFERTYGVSPFNNLLIGFENNMEADNVKTKRLHFNDQALGHGMLQFNFSEKDLKNIPQLEL
jgi:hypothetical protein